MRSGEHWDDYPPDDPPQCNHMGDCDCEPPDEVGRETDNRFASLLESAENERRRNYNERIDTDQ